MAYCMQYQYERFTKAISFCKNKRIYFSSRKDWIKHPQMKIAG